VPTLIATDGGPGVGKDSTPFVPRPMNMPNTRIYVSTPGKEPDHIF